MDGVSVFPDSDTVTTYKGDRSTNETDSDGTTTNTLINDYSIHGRSFVGITIVDIQISYLTSCTCVASCTYIVKS